MRFFRHFSRPLDVTWLGMAWVYSSLLWGAGALVALGMGSTPDAGALFLRGGVTFWAGIGLCAGERWGWAPVVCVCAPEAVFTGALILTGAWKLLTLPPGWLSWQPVLLGLNRSSLLVLMLAAGVWCLMDVGNIALLWWTRAAFDVPRRRAFTVLLQTGALPASVMLLMEVFLARNWWQAMNR